MSTLLEIALANLLMAAALAVPAVMAGWWGRRPALTHGLWLLVLLKLITPPICRVPIALLEPSEEPPVVVGQAFLPAEQQQASMPAPHALAEPPPEPVVPPPGPPAPWPDPAAPAPDRSLPVAESRVPVDPDTATAAPQGDQADAMPAWMFVIAVLWPTGGAAWLLLAAARLCRFQRLLRFAEPAAPSIQSEAQTMAEAMGVRCPQVLVLPGTISPMLWAMGRTPRLLLPAPLLDRLQPAQQATLLAHELAHWRRGDHRVRWLEVLVLALYWWCPFVWWVRRQLHQAEEECCDAWVVTLFPDAARDYALTLVETIDFLSGAPHMLPPVASGVGHVRLLKRRLTMILCGATPKSLTRRGFVLLAGLGLVLLPFVPTVAQPPGNQSDPNVAKALELIQAFLDKNAQDEAARLAARLEDLSLAGRQSPQSLAQAQLDLEAKRAHLKWQLDQLQAAIEQLKQAAKTAARQPGMPGSGMPKNVTGRPPSGPMGMPPGMGGPGGTGKGGSIEQRLEQVERKLDILLWEITNLRRDMGKGHPVPGRAGPVQGGAGNPFQYQPVPGYRVPSDQGGHYPPTVTAPPASPRPTTPQSGYPQAAPPQPAAGGYPAPVGSTAPITGPSVAPPPPVNAPQRVINPPAPSAAPPTEDAPARR